MKLIIDGDVNVNDVQKLCMIFFPGEKFGEKQAQDGENRELYLRIEEQDAGCTAYVRVRDGNREESAEKFLAYEDGFEQHKVHKLACGGAILAACGQLMNYRPSWGMLTGVRPSKIATEYLLSGMSRTRIKKTLSGEYFVSPKKASLATNVAYNELNIIKDTKSTDCSLYISIPFCPTRCAYCSFVSYTTKRLLSLIPEYLEKLMTDIDVTVKTIKELGLFLKTIYIGGGTPTILSAAQIEKLLAGIEKNIDVSKLEEYTFESGRPDTFTLDKMLALKKHGVTRVCVNPQSLCPDVLSEIGRSHTPDDFYRAFEMARKAEIPVINTDLIVGLPGDNYKTFSKTFDEIIALNPENITVHTFCVKKAADILRQNTHVYSLRGGDAGKCVDYSQLQAEANGYVPYYMYRQKNTVGNFENVGFAKPGTEGKYNVYMMEEVHSVFACGAGAVIKMVDYNMAAHRRSKIERLFYPKYPYEYLTEETIQQKMDNIKKFYKLMEEEKNVKE